MSFMDLKERQTGSELVFDGKILHLYHDSVALPNGDTASRELVRHVGAVCVLPITDDGYAVMERQYRYPVDRVLLEIPPESSTASRKTTNPPAGGSWRRKPATMPRSSFPWGSSTPPAPTPTRPSGCTWPRG